MKAPSGGHKLQLPPHPHLDVTFKPQCSTWGGGTGGSSPAGCHILQPPWKNIEKFCHCVIAACTHAHCTIYTRGAQLLLKVQLQWGTSNPSCPASANNTKHYTHHLHTHTHTHRHTTDCSAATFGAHPPPSKCFLYLSQWWTATDGRSWCSHLPRRAACQQALTPTRYITAEPVPVPAPNRYAHNHLMCVCGGGYNCRMFMFSDDRPNK